MKISKRTIFDRVVASCALLLGVLLNARNQSRIHSTSQSQPSGNPVQNERPPPNLEEKDDRVVKVTRHLQLHKAGKDKEFFPRSSDKPLVLLFQWLYAKPSAVNKYTQLYRNIGLDVLTVRGKLSEFLWPPKGIKLSDELLSYLNSNRPVDEKFFVHAFSVGAYNYATAMHEAMEKPEECGHFRDRVIGQIFDSIVIGSYDSMSEGIAQILPENEPFRKMVHQTLRLYYDVTYKTTTATYDKLVEHFKKDPIPVPTLLIYSKNDPMCDTLAVEEMVKNWQIQQPGFDVTRLSWPESVHTAHLKEHRNDYMAAWTELMKKLKLI
ncbi:uncharacterized protein LOC143296982 [Babylonia areolata]|uniref:uncharacterized protein LOC143296982 n=1 Tax=Babylonia areolata TaxID=304850 RepID=UPI003FCFA130